MWAMRLVSFTVVVTLAVLLSAPAALSSGPRARAAGLTGRTVVLNPGHNGGNARAPSFINRQVAIGGGQRKACDTTGTATNDGYAEAAFNWDVALRARRVLRARGARVLLTRTDNNSVGPCIDERARIGNRAGADAVVSIHADGGPPGSGGFHVIEPALVPGLTDDIFSASHRLALALRGAFRSATGSQYASYIGRRGLDRRSDLGGLRLSDVPAVFLESGNMRNAGDARRMRSARWRSSAARGVADGVERFVAGRSPRAR